MSGGIVPETAESGPVIDVGISVCDGFSQSHVSETILGNKVGHDCMLTSPINAIWPDASTAAKELGTDRAGLLLVPCVPEW